MFESIEQTSLFLLSIFLYSVFFAWYASKNRKFDEYVHPNIFKWQIKCSLLLLGTITLFTIAVISPIFLMILEFGFAALFFDSLVINNLLLIYGLPLILVTILLSIVVWPGYLAIIPFTLGFPVLTYVSVGALQDVIFSQLIYQYIAYISFGIVPIYISLFATGRHAVDTLILRLQQAGYGDIATYMRQKSRIGFGSFMAGILFPIALFTRWIMRGTKVGRLKIALSVIFGNKYNWEKCIIVELPNMSRRWRNVS